MFVVLDTNHYDELANDSGCGRNAQRRIEINLSDFEKVPGLRVENWLD